MERFLIASTVRAVVGQRLVRRLCLECREVYAPDATTFKQVANIFGTDSPAVIKQIHQLEEQALKDGIGKNPPATGKNSKKPSTETLATSETKINQLWKAHEDGCNACGRTGYKGRIGIYEVLGSTSEIQKLIVSNATSDIIQNEAVSNGMITMQLDGLIKALRGQTTIKRY